MEYYGSSAFFSPLVRVGIMRLLDSSDELMENIFSTSSNNVAGRLSDMTSQTRSQKQVSDIEKKQCGKVDPTDLSSFFRLGKIINSKRTGPDDPNNDELKNCVLTKPSQGCCQKPPGSDDAKDDNHKNSVLAKPLQGCQKLSSQWPNKKSCLLPFMQDENPQTDKENVEPLNQYHTGVKKILSSVLEKPNHKSLKRKLSNPTSFETLGKKWRTSCDEYNGFTELKYDEPILVDPDDTDQEAGNDPKNLSDHEQYGNTKQSDKFHKKSFRKPDIELRKFDIEESALDSCLRSLVELRLNTNKYDDKLNSSIDKIGLIKYKNNFEKTLEALKIKQRTYSQHYVSVKRDWSMSKESTLNWKRVILALKRAFFLVILTGDASILKATSKENSGFTLSSNSGVFQRVPEAQKEIVKTFLQCANMDVKNFVENGIGKTRPTHSSKATAVLKRWFELHSSKPFPTLTEKEDLAKQAGIEIHQVNTWFQNARLRSPEWRRFAKMGND